MNGHYSQVYPGQAMVGANTLMPMYPYYHYHQSQTMGLPAHIFSPTTTGPIATVPAIMSKPASIAPNTSKTHWFMLCLLHTVTLPSSQVNALKKKSRRNHWCHVGSATANWPFTNPRGLVDQNVFLFKDFAFIRKLEK